MNCSTDEADRQISEFIANLPSRFGNYCPVDRPKIWGVLRELIEQGCELAQFDMHAAPWPTPCIYPPGGVMPVTTTAYFYWMLGSSSDRISGKRRITRDSLVDAARAIAY